jgi:hypothetical protein
MIRVTTDDAIAKQRKRYRAGIAAQYVSAIEALTPADCPHNDRRSCPVCAERRTVAAAIKAVLDTGGQL